MIYTLTGGSGSGKTTIARRLIAEVPHCQMLTSFTTRGPRESDILGEYTCLSQDEFDRLRERNVFEWTTPPMRNKDYGTTTESLDRAFTDDDQHWIMILVPKTLPALYTAADKREKRSWIRSFFIRARAELLRDRLVNQRGISEEAATVDMQHCADWEAQVAATGLPLIVIEDEDDLEKKYQAILAEMQR